MTTQGRFDDARDFRYVIVKSTDDGRLIALQDVARIELGAKDYVTNSYLNGKPAVALGHLPAARAPTRSPRPTEIIDTMKRAVARISRTGLSYDIVYNPTEFIAESINEVYKTIFEAMLLVVIVIIVFLQSWRTAIVPIVAIPVSLIGTFAVLLRLRLLAQHADAVRPGAGDRHRRRRRDRRGRECRAQHRRRAVAARRRRTGPWTRSARRSSRSRWC